MSFEKRSGANALAEMPVAKMPRKGFKPTRITLVISSLGSGGAERVMSILANHWAEHGRVVTLITLSSDAVDWYGLHPTVKRVGLDCLGSSTHIGTAVRNNLERVKRLRHELRKSWPEVVISFMDRTNVLTLVASFGLGIPVIVSERNDPRQQPMDWARGILRSVLYRHAHAVVVQSAAVRKWARRFVRPQAIHVIPNPVNTLRNGREHSSNGGGFGRAVVAMGRLTRQKGFDVLLPAFKVCAEKHEGWSLLILGEGEERRSLEALVDELGLEGRVRLPGLVQDPTLILQEADLFVMSSRYEGFPNALLEAMACGLAVISTDCPSGPGEIIRDGIDGVLVQAGNSNALAAAMDRLMDDQGERERLGGRAVEVRERFGVEKIMKQWDELLGHTYANRAHD